MKKEDKMKSNRKNSQSNLKLHGNQNSKKEIERREHH